MDGNILPEFIKFKNNKFTVLPKEPGNYPIKLCLDDGYSFPTCL